VFGWISGRGISGGASSHAPPPLRRVDPRATASNWKQRDRGQPLLPFLFLPAVTTTVICKKKENASKVSVLPPLLDLLSFLRLFKSASSLIFLLFTSSPSLQVAGSWAALQCAEGGGESVARGGSVEISSPGGSSGGWACCWCQPDEGGRRFGLWGRIGCWFL